MGTSIVQIEDTGIARWLTRTDEQLRVMFDTYDQVAHATFTD